MTVTYCPYQGIKKMRYLFMAEHLPEQLKELKRQGMPALDAYMDQVQKDYGRTITEYVNHWDKTHQHLKQPSREPSLPGAPDEHTERTKVIVQPSPQLALDGV